MDWIYDRFDDLNTDDIFYTSTEFLDLDGNQWTTTSRAYNCFLNALKRGAKIYLFVDRWMSGGCAYPNITPCNQIGCFNNLNSDNCGVKCSNNMCFNDNSYPGCPNSNGPNRSSFGCYYCNKYDEYIKEFQKFSNFYLYDIASNNSNTWCDFSQDRPNLNNIWTPPFPPSGNQIMSIEQQKSQWGRDGVSRTHDKKIVFLYPKLDLAAVYIGSMNADFTDSSIQWSTVRETGWGIISKISSNFIQQFIKKDRCSINMLIPKSSKNVKDYGYNIENMMKKSNNQHGTNLDNWNIIDIFDSLINKTSNDIGKPINANINWTCPNFETMDTASQLEWLSGRDENVTITIGVTPSPNKPTESVIDFSDNIWKTNMDIYGNIKKDNFIDNSWKKYNNDMNKRTNSIYQYSDTDPSNAYEWCSGAVWSGNLIAKLVGNAIKNNSRYLKISLYHGDFFNNTIPVYDDETPETTNSINLF